MLFTEIVLALLIVMLKPIGLQWKNYSMAKSLLVNRKIQQRTKASFSLLAPSKMKSLIWTSYPTASILRYVAYYLLRAPRPQLKKDTLSITTLCSHTRHTSGTPTHRLQVQSRIKAV